MTRTTMRIGGSLTAPSVAHVLHALRHVPGVLLVEIDADTARAVVAHDSAVSTTSLLAAAAGAGGPATIVADARTIARRADAARPSASMSIRRVVLTVTALLVVQTLFGLVDPSFAKAHAFLPFVLALVSSFVLFSVTFRRRT